MTINDILAVLKKAVHGQTFQGHEKGLAIIIFNALEQAGLEVVESWRPIEEAPRKRPFTEPLPCWTPEGLDLCWYSEGEPDGPDSMGHDAGWWGCNTPCDPGRSFGNPDYQRPAECQPTMFFAIREPKPPEGQG